MIVAQEMGFEVVVTMTGSVQMGHLAQETVNGGMIAPNAADGAGVDGMEDSGAGDAGVGEGGEEEGDDEGGDEGVGEGEGDFAAFSGSDASTAAFSRRSLRTSTRLTKAREDMV